MVTIISLMLAIVVYSYIKCQRQAMLTICLETLQLYQDALDQYVFDHNLYPDSIDDLLQGKYIKKIHECAVGGLYHYSVGHENRSYHLWCSGRHTEDINYLSIRDTQRPEAGSSP